jgi:hypothetical protein
MHMAPTVDRFRLARRVTASQWETVFWHQWNEARRARGIANASDGTKTPRVSNREAMALIRAWRAVSAMTTEGFALWYQFAAIAYAWTVKRDTLTATALQAAKLYPLDATKELWLAVQRIANALDVERRGQTDPGVDLDPDEFTNPVIMAEVRKALREDGASASWVIGFGGCKDPKTGKPARPRGKCDVVQTPTGPVLKNCKFECEPYPIEIDDPFGMRPLLLLALVLGAWWAYDNKPRRHRRD